MKKLPLIAVIALACTVAASRVSAQSAMFTYTGVPAAPVVPGSSFTIGISLVLVTGGNIPNVQGFSLWMAQLSPGVGPFPFAITIRDATGGAFIPDRVVFPQVLDPISRNSDGTPTATDLGGQSAAAPLSSGTYFIYNLTFSLAANALPGNYTIGSTTSSVPGVGGRFSVISDLSGNNTFPVAASSFNITVVPEPSSIALLCVGLVSAGALAYRRRVAAR